MTNIDISPQALIHAAHRFHLRATSIMLFLIYWAMILTYPDFFIFNPMAEANILRQISLWLCLLGWLIASLGTSILLWLTSDGYHRYIKWIPLTALWWPASIVLSQLTSYMVTGNSYLGYIIDYPIFVITDIALPALAIFKWFEMKKFITDANHKR